MPRFEPASSSHVRVVDGRHLPFFMVENGIFDAPVSAYAKLVYMNLCRRADGNGASYPKLATIARDCRISHRSVWGAVQELVVAKLILVESGVHDGRPNTYTVKSPSLANGSAHGLAPGASPHTQGLHEVQPGLAPGANQGLHQVPTEVDSKELDPANKTKIVGPHEAALADRANGHVKTALTADVWAAYSAAYRARYGADPVRNYRTNALLKEFLGRVPTAEAPAVAAFYVEHGGKLYVAAGHAVNLMLRDAEKLRTEWFTGRRITETGARFSDQHEERAGIAERLIAKAQRQAAAEREA